MTKTNVGYLDELGREVHPSLGVKSDVAVELGEQPDTLHDIIAAAVNAALVKADIARGPAANSPDDLYDWDEDVDYSTMSEHSIDLQEAALRDELSRLEAWRAAQSVSSVTSQPPEAASPQEKEAALADPAAGAA